MEQDSAGESITERKHQFAKSQIQSAAFKLFLQGGYEGTTVEEIADAAGISRRTFFRYFETKEDVLIAALARSGEFMASLLQNRPPHERPFTALRQTIIQLLTHYQHADPHAWEVLNLIQKTPRLRARFLLARDAWTRQLTDILVERAISPKRAEVIVFAGLGMLTLIYHRWHQDRDIDLAQAVNDAFEDLKAICEE